MPYQIKNGIVYGSNAVSLTQAQYDALSTAEKNNGTVYYIYDSEAVLDASDVSLGSGTVEDLAGSVAVIETSPTTATHAVGSYLVYNGQLYKVTSAISAGATLTPGTNISAVSVGGELTSLNNDLTNLTSSTLATNSGWTTTQNRVIKRAGCVELYIECIFSNEYTSGWNTIATVPNGYRPIETFDTVSLDNSNGTACDIKVTAGGLLQVYKIASVSKNLRIHLFYMTNL